MSMTQIRRALVGLAMLVTLAAFAPAHAAKFTYTDFNCAGFSISPGQVAGEFVLNCAKLACSISSSAGVNITPLNAPTLLTASCVPAADAGFVWSVPGGSNPAGCPSLPGTTGTTQTLAPTGQSGTVSGCVYQADGTSTSSGGGSQTISLSYSATAVTPPGGCAVTRTPANGQLAVAGGPITLTGNCTNPAATSWAWTKAGSAFGTSAALQNDTLGANGLTTAVTTTYIGTPSNGGTSGSPITATFTTAGTGSGGGGGGGFTGSCAGFTRTIPLSLKYVAGVTDAAITPGFFDGEIVVATFTTPATLVNSGDNSKVSWVQTGTSVYQIATLSTVACDLNPPPSSMAIKGALGGSNIYIYAGTATALKPSTTYYVNFKNTACGYVPGTTVPADCSIKVSLTPK